MRDFMEEDRARRMDEHLARQDGHYGGDDGFNDIIEWLVMIVFGFVVILGVAGFLDDQFGWGLTDWLMGTIRSWGSG